MYGFHPSSILVNINSRKTREFYQDTLLSSGQILTDFLPDVSSILLSRHLWLEINAVHAPMIEAAEKRPSAKT